MNKAQEKIKAYAQILKVYIRSGRNITGELAKKSLIHINENF